MKLDFCNGGKENQFSKQAAIDRVLFVKLYSIIKIFFLFRTTFFLSRKATWVAIDCCSKNWVAVLKSLGSTGLFNNDASSSDLYGAEWWSD
jgi:hypothetical protein